MTDTTRRQFIFGTIATAIGAAIPQSNAQTHATKIPQPKNIVLTATKWSEMPELLEKYEAMIDKEQGGVSRIFGYASIINDHKNEKPPASKDVPNESVKLHGMVVGMNVLAAGEVEYRGTRDTYVDEQGKTKHFANVGVYAGLEATGNPDEFASGITVTAVKNDRRASLKSYIKRELGEPPAGITFDDLFDNTAKVKFAALEGNPKNNFGMYKFHVANVETAEGKTIPAVTVATNEKSPFSAIGKSPIQTAHYILDGQGYSRTIDGTKKGGSDLAYFKDNVIGVQRKLGLTQPRLEEIDQAVSDLAKIYAEANKIFDKNLPQEQLAAEMEKLIIANRDKLEGVSSPLFHDGENVNERPPVPPEEKAASNKNEPMPTTAKGKLERIASLDKDGKTAPTPRSR
jgi:hypothetical protein